ncbi:MAG: 1-acyl-sn-glycerol-3-phosphate acyltransferase [Bacilli bacterium]|nr:1-acyl-sn-glycerol-3-phosphate acyltransferase [Bacilli bacterium]
MEIRDKKFYKIVKPLVSLFIKICYKPTVIGKENIPKSGRILLAGNHTKQLDSIMLVGVQPRQIHFLAKEELFHGITKWIVKGMGCVPVNRKIHDKNALQAAMDYLEKDLCVGIFPEGTINRTENVIMPFKIGAVKACHDTKSKLVPFVITGKYRLFKKGIQVEFLPPMGVEDNLDEANEKLMTIIENKLIEGGSTKCKRR